MMKRKTEVRVNNALGVLALCAIFALPTAFAVSGGAPVPFFNSPPPTHEESRFQLETTPTVRCVEEDSNDCLWDAETSGNGEGTSFHADSDGNLKAVYLIECDVTCIYEDVDGTLWEVSRD